MKNKDPLQIKESSPKHKRKSEKKKREERRITKSPQRMNKIEVIRYLSTITLNVNGLTVPIKRHRVVE